MPSKAPAPPAPFRARPARAEHRWRGYKGRMDHGNADVPATGGEMAEGTPPPGPCPRWPPTPLGPCPAGPCPAPTGGDGAGRPGPGPGRPSDRVGPTRLSGAWTAGGRRHRPGGGHAHLHPPKRASGPYQLRVRPRPLTFGRSHALLRRRRRRHSRRSAGRPASFSCGGWPGAGARAARRPVVAPAPPAARPLARPGGAEPRPQPEA